MITLEHGIPKGCHWDDYLKNSKPPTREEILGYAQREEYKFKIANLTGWILLGVGLFLLAMPLTDIRIVGSMTVVAGMMNICYAYLFGQISFASIQRMWERCENQEAELRKSIAQDL